MWHFSPQRCHLSVPKRYPSLLPFPSPSWDKAVLSSVSTQSYPPQHWQEALREQSETYLPYGAGSPLPRSRGWILVTSPSACLMWLLTQRKVCLVVPERLEPQQQSFPVVAPAEWQAGRPEGVSSSSSCFPLIMKREGSPLLTRSKCFVSS